MSGYEELRGDLISILLRHYVMDSRECADALLAVVADALAVLHQERALPDTPGYCAGCSHFLPCPTLALVTPPRSDA